MNKEELKQAINYIRSNDGEITFNYIPKDVIDSAKKMYGLYYGDGHEKIYITKKYIKLGVGRLKEINEAELDNDIEEICKLLTENFTDEISQAIENLGWQDEMIKYFDRQEHKQDFKDFKTEVLRLKGLK